MSTKLFFTCLLNLLALTSFAQLREIPKEVAQAFTTQYTGADNVEYKDNLVNVKVAFTQKGERLLATYTNAGKWKETEKPWNFEQLSPDIKDGFQKSKYADWNVKDTKVVYRPDGVELYRVKVEKNEVMKKNLFFNSDGRLVEDLITL